jgi:hypothetical protein
MKAKCFDRAVEVLQGAHSLAVDKFGEETPEACECGPRQRYVLQLHVGPVTHVGGL